MKLNLTYTALTRRHFAELTSRRSAKERGIKRRTSNDFFENLGSVGTAAERRAERDRANS